MNYIAQEDPILLSEIVDQIFLVAIDPAATVSTMNCNASGIARGYSLETASTKSAVDDSPQPTFRTLRGRRIVSLTSG